MSVKLRVTGYRLRVSGKRPEHWSSGIVGVMSHGLHATGYRLRVSPSLLWGEDYGEGERFLNADS